MKSLFCTYFDSSYLVRGILMFMSLRNVMPDAHLYVITFDNIAYTLLKEMSLDGMTVIALEEFEDQELLRVKPYRTRAEYCWTCTPSVMLYVLDKFSLPNCIYVDADLFFFSSPRILLDEMESADHVMITPHRYTKQFDKTNTAGKYNVQFIPCRNTEIGREILCWWRESCIRACTIDPEKGLCGDQKYLDEWPEKFEGVRELMYLGGGVGPWNVQQYIFFEKDNMLYGKDMKTDKEFIVVFYHYHALKIWDSYTLFGKEIFRTPTENFSLYPLPDSAVEYIYVPYIRKLNLLSSTLVKEYGARKIDGFSDMSNKLPIKSIARIYYQKVLNNLGINSTRNRNSD